jgi:hypothetical protein
MPASLPAWQHPRSTGRLLGGGLSVLALDSYELHVISERYSGWSQLCVRAQPCMQGSGDAAYLLCMLCCLNIQLHSMQPDTRCAKLVW